MKKALTVLSVLLFCVSWAVGVYAEPEARNENPVPLNERISVQISKEGPAFYASGAMYSILADGIALPNSILYFAAKDFNTNKSFLVRKVEKIESVTDTPEEKVVKITFLLGDEKNKNDINPNYRLELCAEIRRGHRTLALMSRFFYLGAGVHKCGINWGISSSIDSNPFKYYTIPDKSGKNMTYRLEPTGRMKPNKIGYANWLYLHGGKGYGLGVICPSMLGKGEDFVFINTVKPQKNLSNGKSADIFMVFFPVDGSNIKNLPGIYDDVKKKYGAEFQTIISQSKGN